MWEILSHACRPVNKSIQWSTMKGLGEYRPNATSASLSAMSMRDLFISLQGLTKIQDGPRDTRYRFECLFNLLSGHIEPAHSSKVNEVLFIPFPSLQPYYFITITVSTHNLLCSFSSREKCQWLSSEHNREKVQLTSGEKIKVVSGI